MRDAAHRNIAPPNRQRAGRLRGAKGAAKGPKKAALGIATPYNEAVTALAKGREFARIRASNTGEAVADPYLVLGVTPDATDQDLKMAYRRAVAENHPDRLIARGVPEEFVTLATEKLAAINTAWEALKQERGIA